MSNVKTQDLKTLVFSFILVDFISILTCYFRSTVLLILNLAVLTPQSTFTPGLYCLTSLALEQNSKRLEFSHLATHLPVTTLPWIQKVIPTVSLCWKISLWIDWIVVYGMVLKRSRLQPRSLFQHTHKSVCLFERIC